MSSRSYAPDDFDEFLSSLATLTEEEAADKLFVHDSASDDPEFHRFVAKLHPMYRSNILSIDDHVYPCVAFDAPLPRLINEKIDNALEKELRSTSPQCKAKVAQYQSLMYRIEEARRETESAETLYDGWNFALAALAPYPLQIGCHPCRYFEALASCDALKCELQMAWQATRGAIADLSNPLSLLKYRSKLINSESEKCIVSGGGRAAALAVSTLLCHKNRSGRFTCVLACRSEKKLAVDRNRFHVIPSGMFSPARASRTEPFSIFENVLREYLEELFRVQESPAADPRWHHHHDPVKRLEDMIANRTATIYLTGLCVNLLNLRPEICTLLLITSDDWERVELPKVHHNIEYSDQPGTLEHIPLMPMAEAIQRNYRLRPTQTVPPGAAAYWLGSRAALQETGMAHGE